MEHLDESRPNVICKGMATNYVLNNPVNIDLTGLLCKSIDPPGKFKTYTVKKGDTYSALALKYKVTVEQLRAWNGYKDTKIPIGVDLQVGPEQQMFDPDFVMEQELKRSSIKDKTAMPTPRELPDQVSVQVDEDLDLASLGLISVEAGLEMVLKVTDYEKFNSALKNGNFVLSSSEGSKLYKLGYNGNQYQPANLISKAKDMSYSKSAKFVALKVLSNGLVVYNIYDTLDDMITGESSPAKGGLDLFFIGFTAFPIVGPTTSIVYFGVDEFIGWERAGEILKRLNDYNIEVTGEPIVPPYKI